jgi:ribosome-binding factor A
LGSDPQVALEGLSQAAGFLRNLLFKKLHIHTVPTLHFVYDQTPERAADMNSLIAKAVSVRALDD